MCDCEALAELSFILWNHTSRNQKTPLFNLFALHSRLRAAKTKGDAQQLADGRSARVVNHPPPIISKEEWQ